MTVRELNCVSMRKPVRRRWIDAAADMALMLTAVRQVELLKKRSIEIKKAQILISTAPVVRQELVSGIADAIAVGRYCVTGADIVPLMIREHMMDPLR